MPGRSGRAEERGTEGIGQDIEPRRDVDGRVRGGQNRESRRPSRLFVPLVAADDVDQAILGEIQTSLQNKTKLWPTNATGVWSDASPTTTHRQCYRGTPARKPAVAETWSTGPTGSAQPRRTGRRSRPRARADGESPRDGGFQPLCAGDAFAERPVSFRTSD